MHSDESVYRQCLRRLKQWNTKDVSGSEVECNVELIYSVGQNIGYGAKQVQDDILAATGITNLGDFIDHRQNPDEDEEQAEVQVAKGPVGSKNKPREPAKPAKAPATPTPLLNKLTEKARSTMGTIKEAQQKTKKDAGKDKETKKKEKSAVIHVEEDEDNDEDDYEYYSSSEEPPAKKKQKKEPSSSSKKQEEMDVHGWKKRAVELEKMLHKETRENKSLRRQLSSVRAKKTKKSRSWKKDVRSLLEAGNDSSTSDADKE